MDTLALILEIRLNRKVSNKQQHTPFLVAAAHHKVRAMAKHKDSGANITHTTDRCQTALSPALAVAAPAKLTAQVLQLTMGSPPFDSTSLQLVAQKLPDQKTVLHIACSSGNSAAVDLPLKKRPCNAKGRTIEGHTPLLKVSVVFRVVFICSAELWCTKHACCTTMACIVSTMATSSICPLFDAIVRC